MLSNNIIFLKKMCFLKKHLADADFSNTTDNHIFFLTLKKSFYLFINLSKFF